MLVLAQVERLCVIAGLLLSGRCIRRRRRLAKDLRAQRREAQNHQQQKDKCPGENASGHMYTCNPTLGIANRWPRLSG